VTEHEWIDKHYWFRAIGDQRTGALGNEHLGIEARIELGFEFRTTHKKPILLYNISAKMSLYVLSTKVHSLPLGFSPAAVYDNFPHLSLIVR
jgi:hypothetical protein